MGKNLSVEAGSDYLQGMARNPAKGLQELIWNALDADASEVNVSWQRSALGAINRITVADNGEGITASRIDTGFSRLGDSWKRSQPNSASGRTHHGKQGKGRFAAYALGQVLQWDTQAVGVEGLERCIVSGRGQVPNQFRLETRDPDGTGTGTKVEIGDVLEKAARYLESDRVYDDLVKTFALYIQKYHVDIFVEGRRVDPASLIETQVSRLVRLDPPLTRDVLQLQIITWKKPMERRLYLCDEAGVALHEMQPGIHAPGFDFSAYALWHGFAEQGSAIELGKEGPAPLPTAIEAVQEELKTHFKQQARIQNTKTLAGWKEEGVYPYASGEGDQENPARDLFDLVAVTAASSFKRQDRVGRKLSLMLLKEALENKPSKLTTILREVLSLNDSQVDELTELIEKTSLSEIITTSTLVTQRLEFLGALEEIIRPGDLKKLMKERAHLQKILERESWIFGEEYALIGHDQTLKTVLKDHKSEIGADTLVDSDLQEEVLDAEGRRVVPDMILHGKINGLRGRKTNLVVELKRPSEPVRSQHIEQTIGYSLTVAEDPRFAQTDTHWEFWIVGDVLDSSTKSRTSQVNQEPGVVSNTSNPSITVRAMTWAQIIDDARERLSFLQKSIAYAPDSEQSLQYLTSTHEEFLPKTAVIAAA